MDDPTKIDLVTPFELYGKWWRAAAEQDKSVPGCLSYTREHGLQLQLYDKLPNEGPLWQLKPAPRQPIWGEVFGFAGTLVKVSLFDEIFTNRPNDPKVEDKTPHPFYYVNRAVVGTHTIDFEALRLRSIHFSISEYEEFLHTKPVAPLHDTNSVKVEYTPDAPLELTLSQPDEQNLRGTIRTLVASNASWDDLNCTISYRASMKLAGDDPMSFSDGFDLVSTLSNFFLICARGSVDRRYIRGILESGEMISWFGQMRQRATRKTARDWVLTLKDIEASFESILKNWLILVKKLRFVGPVFFSELRSPSPVQDARFFHFAGCLEAFHREVVQEKLGKFLPRSDYKKMMEALLQNTPATIPEALKDAMCSALSQANDHSFAERLHSLFLTLEPETRQMVAEEPERFLTAIKKSRNKLAHVTDDAAGDIFEGVEFARANVCLHAWLTILLLKECGIAESTIRERMKAISFFEWGPFKFEPRAG